MLVKKRKFLFQKYLFMLAEYMPPILAFTPYTLHPTPEETSHCSSLLFPASSLLYYWLFNYIFVLNPPKIFSFFLKFPASSPLLLIAFNL
jgi:hypothetical protein